MSAALKLWTGPSMGVIKHTERADRGFNDRADVTVYVSAESMAQVATLISEYRGRRPFGLGGHLKNWGEVQFRPPLADIPDEPGIWLMFGTRAPERVWPKPAKVKAAKAPAAKPPKQEAS